jgi:hypothetical protein
LRRSNPGAATCGARAIQTVVLRPLDCFASLAMTDRELAHLFLRVALAAGRDGDPERLRSATTYEQLPIVTEAARAELLASFEREEKDLKAGRVTRMNVAEFREEIQSTLRGSRATQPCEPGILPPSISPVRRGLYVGSSSIRSFDALVLQVLGALVQ